MNSQLGSLLQQSPADINRGRLARVSRVLLEGETENGDALARDGVEHRRDHLVGEAALLVVVHDDNLE
jgi:hypothetical protein